jgi:hypothetical protein
MPGDLVIPLIFFIDKTFVDALGRLTIEPVSFTLAIFKKEFCQRAEFWCTLGYIPNQDNVRSSLKPLDKAIDYHYALSLIFVVAAFVCLFRTHSI